MGNKASTAHLYRELLCLPQLVVDSFLSYPSSSHVSQWTVKSTLITFLLVLDQRTISGRRVFVNTSLRKVLFISTTARISQSFAVVKIPLALLFVFLIVVQTYHLLKNYCNNKLCLIFCNMYFYLPFTFMWFVYYLLLHWVITINKVLKKCWSIVIDLIHKNSQIWFSLIVLFYILFN